jgi:hypothetical protein
MRPSGQHPVRKSLFQRHYGLPEIVSAHCQRPCEHRIRSLRRIEYAGFLLFCGDIAVEDPDDAANVRD